MVVVVGQGGPNRRPPDSIPHRCLRLTHRLVEREEARLERHKVEVLVEDLGHERVSVGGDGGARQLLHQGAVQPRDEVEVHLRVEPLAAVVGDALDVLLRPVQEIDGGLCGGGGGGGGVSWNELTLVCGNGMQWSTDRGMIESGDRNRAVHQPADCLNPSTPTTETYLPRRGCPPAPPPAAGAASRRACGACSR